MCGIIGATSSRSVDKILIKGLQSMEYRGYDSAGIALNQKNQVFRLRAFGKVSNLEKMMVEHKPKAKTGIAHTRWATHGEPSEDNAHPHGSNDEVYIVHNGIIENHESIRARLKKEGYKISSQTDSELIAHLIHFYKQKLGKTTQAMIEATKELKGAYSIAVIDKDKKG